MHIELNCSKFQVSIWMSVDSWTRCRFIWLLILQWITTLIALDTKEIDVNEPMLIRDHHCKYVLHNHLVHYLIQENKDVMLEILFNHPKTDFNDLDSNHESPIDLAKRYMKKEVLEQLLLHKKYGNQIHKNLLFDIIRYSYLNTKTLNNNDIILLWN